MMGILVFSIFIQQLIRGYDYVDFLQLMYIMLTFLEEIDIFGMKKAAVLWQPMSIIFIFTLLQQEARFHMQSRREVHSIR